MELGGGRAALYHTATSAPVQQGTQYVNVRFNPRATGDVLEIY